MIEKQQPYISHLLRLWPVSSGGELVWRHLWRVPTPASTEALSTWRI